MTRKCWSDEMVADGLAKYGEKLGRMPSVQEMRAAGENDLACVVARRGGVRRWAARLGLEMKPSETLMGRGYEALVAEMLRSRGHEVDRQSVKAPFDLLVDGSIRVDVKAANWSENLRKSDGAIVRGFVFAGCKRGTDCDFFVLFCLRDESPFATYMIPAAAVDVVTITITSKVLDGQGKWSPYRDDGMRTIHNHLAEVA